VLMREAAGWRVAELAGHPDVRPIGNHAPTVEQAIKDARDRIVTETTRAALSRPGAERAP